MTKAELDRLNDDDRKIYFEQEYPYVLPENEVIDIIDAQMLLTFSPLEIAYIRWMIEVSNAELAVDKFIHPAYWFDKEQFGAKTLKGRAYLGDFLRKLRRECPYLKLYTGDYLAGLLNDEVQYLRSRERKNRFYGPNADSNRLVGKKSPHDQEMEEIDRLLACLKQIHDLKVAASQMNDSSIPGQIDPDSGIDRVIATATKLINGKEAGTT